MTDKQQSTPSLNREDQKVRGYWQDAWYHLLRDRFALAGGIVVLLLIIMSVAAPWVAPYNPLKQFPDGLTERGMPISSNARFLLGTDALGRDLLSRLIWGGRISITVGVFANVISIGIAVIIGGAAGYLGGWIDMIAMRLTDIALSLPAVLLMIAIATVLPPSVGAVTLVISIFAWAYPSRVVRGKVVSIRQEEFIQAAKCIGASQVRIFFFHVIPQLLPTLVVYFTIRVPSAILTEAGLSFLGLGVPLPTPSWGNMILAGSRMYRSAFWIVLYPGLFIMLTVLSFNLFGDGLRDALDPREHR